MVLSSLGLSAVDHLALQAWEGLPLGALVNGAQSGAGQGREPRPGLDLLPWPVTEKYLSKPPLVTVEPQAAEGLRMSRIILATFSFAFTLSSISRSSVMKWLRYFLLEIVKKTKSPWNRCLSMTEIRPGFNPLIALSLICLLSPNHNWHIYVL